MINHECFSFDEASLILAYYLFERNQTSSGLVRFTKQLNQTFLQDLSPESVAYYIASFRNLDPLFSNEVRLDSAKKVIWDFYLDDNRRKQLKQLYQNFKADKFCYNDFMNHIDSQIEFNDRIMQINLNSVGLSTDDVKIIDKPKQLYDNRIKLENSYYRDSRVSQNALILAHFICEYNENHESFIRKSDNHRYMEAHHLVPLKYQYYFDVNLDVEANVVSLCSNCHNELHYGKDFEEILYVLYKKRESRLKNCGILVTYEILRDMYR